MVVVGAPPLPPPLPPRPLISFVLCEVEAVCDFPNEEKILEFHHKQTNTQTHKHTNANACETELEYTRINLTEQRDFSLPK